MVDRPTQLGRQDRERFGGTTFLLLLLLPFAGPFAGAQKQARRLTEGPTQMGVADLLRSRAELLARRLVGATHQPGVGEELADVLETRHIVQFVQQHQGENRADAGNAAQTVIALGVVYLDGAGQVKLGGADEFIELVDKDSFLGNGGRLHWLFSICKCVIKAPRWCTRYMRRRSKSRVSRMPLG